MRKSDFKTYTGSGENSLVKEGRKEGKKERKGGGEGKRKDKARPGQRWEARARHHAANC